MAIIEETALADPLSPRERSRLEDALEKLRRQERPCADYLWQKHMVGLSYEELGRVYGLSADAIRVRIHRGLKQAGIRTPKED
jgi:DNA-directed RNA polymerase specialized sigma24 family protein